MTITTAKQLAQQFVYAYGSEQARGALVSEGGLASALAKWLDEVEGNAFGASLDDSDPAASQLVQDIRQVNVSELLLRVQLLIDPENEAIWADPARLPLDIYAANRWRYVKADTGQGVGIFG